MDFDVLQRKYKKKHSDDHAVLFSEKLPDTISGMPPGILLLLWFCLTSGLSGAPLPINVTTETVATLCNNQ